MLYISRYNSLCQSAPQSDRLIFCNLWWLMNHTFSWVFKLLFSLTCHVKISEAGDSGKPISMVMVWLLFNKSFWILNNSWTARWNAISSLWALESQDSVLAGKKKKQKVGNTVRDEYCPFHLKLVLKHPGFKLTLNTFSAGRRMWCDYKVMTFIFLCCLGKQLL